MNLRNPQNTAVAAPEFLDTNSVLTKYRVWSGRSEAGRNDLYFFLTQPSKERNAFLLSLEQRVNASGNFYARQFFV